MWSGTSSCIIDLNMIALVFKFIFNPEIFNIFFRIILSSKNPDCWQISKNTRSIWRVYFTSVFEQFQTYNTTRRTPILVNITLNFAKSVNVWNGFDGPRSKELKLVLIFVGWGEFKMDLKYECKKSSRQ